MGLFKKHTSKKYAENDSLSAEERFEKIFKTYFARLCYFSLQIVGERAVAEDLVQEAFVKYWEQKHEVSDQELAIKSFLYSTVRNASLNLIRHRKVEQEYIAQHAKSSIEEAYIVHAMIKTEVLGEIHRAVASLPERCQQISRMSYLDGMKNHEIAQELGISVNTVKTQKQRGLSILRLKFKPDIFT